MKKIEWKPVLYLLIGLSLGAASGWLVRQWWLEDSFTPIREEVGAYQIVRATDAESVWRVDTRTGEVSKCALGTVKGEPQFICLGPAREETLPALAK